MTAIVSRRPVAASEFGRFAGLGALVRKDTTEWMRGRRAWIVFALSTLFMVFTAANAWILQTISENDPNFVPADHEPWSLAPLDNLMAAISGQIFVLVVIFAVASLIVRERESGTLAWVASKPVSRGSIWLSKFVTAGGILAIVAVIAPLAITGVAVVAMYGMPDPATVLIVTAGATALALFFTALGLAAGTVLPSQPAIAATGFIVFAIVPLVLGMLPLPIGPYLPTSILGWTFGVATGADVGWVTPVAWAVWTAAVGAFAVRQMNRIEL